MAASDYIRHLVEIVERNKRIVIYCRVSGWVQEWKHNLTDQEESLAQWCKGLNVLRSFSEVASGYCPSDERQALLAAIEYARDNQAIIVAESTSRFIRNRNWRTYNQSVQPTILDFSALKEWAGEIELATVYHPDISWKQERRIQTERGMRAKANKEPEKYSRIGTQRQNALKRLIVQLAVEKGLSMREIAKRVLEKRGVSLSRMTVCTILREQMSVES